MGMIFLGVVALLFGVIVAFGVYKLFKKVPIVKKVITMLANKILFNTFIRTFIAGYLVFALSAFRNVHAMNFSTTADTISAALAILMTIGCSAAPLVMFLFLKKNLASLALPKFTNRCNTLYIGTRIDKIDAVLYNVFFVARRLFMAGVIVFCAGFPAF